MRPKKRKKKMGPKKRKASLYVFNWEGGGYNSVSASSKAQARKLAKQMGTPPIDGGRTRKLVPVDSSIRRVNIDQLMEIDRSYSGD